ncbi:hypothetical protein ACFVH6_21665 [Spirillospora sp. NPDC127200]
MSTEYDHTQIPPILDGITDLAQSAPNLHAVLAALGPLGEACEESTSHIWGETYDLRPSEKAHALLLLGLGLDAIRATLTEVGLGGATDEVLSLVEDATQMCADADHKLQEASALLQTAPSRD